MTSVNKPGHDNDTAASGRVGRIARRAIAGLAIAVGLTLGVAAPALATAADHPTTSLAGLTSGPIGGDWPWAGQT